MPIRPRPWMMLAVMVFGQAATTVVVATPAFLIPYFTQQRGMGLAGAGLLAGMPNLGLVLALFLWGALADRIGERRVLLVGLGLSTVAVVLSMLAGDAFWLGAALVLSGAMTACINNTSGRLITGWFPAHRRGLVMGIRQTCQPLGMAIAAVAIPPIAAGAGLAAAFGFGGALLVVSLVACACTVVDSPGAHAPAAGTDAERPANPYRGSAALVRIHAVSMLLVIPQFALSTFGLVWFTVGLGWSALAAGTLVAVAQFAGAAGRIVVGVWSDRVRSRLRPLLQVSVAGVIVLLLAAAFGWAEWSAAAAVAFVVASCVSVADNGLAFTAVAEIAGRGWAGRALGIQNTGQFLAAAAVGPIVGGLISVVGVPAALAVIAAAPALAVPLVPRERARLRRGPERSTDAGLRRVAASER
ncbi:MFS transporter [Leucobacter zeae]|nr:MFS transporter [Leucobacter zeae]